VSPVKYEMGFYIPEDDILHSHRRENLKSYTYVHNTLAYADRNVYVAVVTECSLLLEHYHNHFNATSDPDVGH
jgi:hypothetical protein